MTSDNLPFLFQELRTTQKAGVPFFLGFIETMLTSKKNPASKVV
jgi:hypothetical protein